MKTVAERLDEMAENIVSAVMRDLRGRKGIKSALEDVDEDVMEGMLLTLREKVKSQIMNSLEGP